MGQIVVRLPHELDELVCSFAFIENLKFFYETDDIHLIVDKDYAPYLVLLPFNAFIHVFDNDEYPGVLDIPRFVAHQRNITDVARFYSLTDSKIDAAFGKAFNAKEKVGFKFGFSANILFDKKILCSDSLHPMHKYLKLMEGNLKKDANYFSRELTSIVQDLYMPYIVININYQQEKGRLDPKWCDYIDYYQKYTIYIMSETAPQKEMKDLVARYRINSGQENRLMYFENDSELKLAQLLYHAKGFISDETSLSFISSYMGVPTIEFTQKVLDAIPLSKVYLKKDQDEYSPATTYDDSFDLFSL
jgi:ADP-heptose:LPS heptosyltransferase